MSEAECVPQVGLVGHRSFISRALVAEFTRRGFHTAVFTKNLLGEEDLRHLDCVYLVLGRARPSPEEAAAELEHVRAYCSNPLRCARTVYLSSQREYAHKRKAEALIDCVGGISVAPPAVFGPGQALDSEMLVPSLVRTAGTVKLERPLRPTAFIHVDRLAQYLATLSRETMYRARRELSRVVDPGIPGTFTLTPTQMRDLYLTFSALEEAWRNRDPEDGPPYQELSAGTPGTVA